MRHLVSLAACLSLLACRAPAPTPEAAPVAAPAASTPAPPERVASYEAEVQRICEDARTQVLMRAEATRCTSDAPARWESMVAESFKWMDQSRRPIQPEEMTPTQASGETRCEEVVAEPLTEAELTQLDEISQAAAGADTTRASWEASPEDEAAMKEHLFALEQLHGACLRLSASRL